ncbi:type II toxin-antitoxin system VapB family antitoxin [Streptomyces rubiginosohelvolus]|uniref:type II toxin-antitoxin system VapB family antitoxin n=2 Tax=Streptomyces TaxID=1883 RepID=UPI0035E1212C
MDTTTDTELSEPAEAAERARRFHALRDLQDIARDGGLDMDILLDKRRYRSGPPANC